MGGLFRKLFIYICVPIYNLIVYMYKIFYSIATTRFLKDDLIQQFSSNIYVLVSAVMLFAFSITILSAIVNPDLLTDNKKGVSALFKRSIIALALMVLVPFAFNQLYDIQESVMTNSLIEKIVVGINLCDPDTDSNCEIGGNGGQVIAGTLISSVLYPAGDEISVNEDISENYKNMVAKDIRNIGLIAPDINTTVDDSSKLHYHFDDEDYAFHFDGLIAIIAELATVYILTIYAIDVAVRVFKLAFLELTAPISIVAYVGVGDKMLSSWFKELGKTYAELFVRVVAIAFYLFLMNNLDKFMSAFTDGDWISVLKVFLIVGMLIFVKQVPDMLGRIFGVDIKLKGGIGGRLGEMAGVGEQAKKAWQGIKNTAGLVAGVGALGAAGAAMGIPAALGVAGGTFAGKKLWDKKLKDTKFGSGVKKAGNVLGTAGRGVAAVGKTASAFAGGKGTIQGLSAAKKTYSESGFGLETMTNSANRKAKKIENEFNEKMGNNDYGMVENSELATNNFKANSKKDLGKVRGEAVDALLDANIQKAKVDKISSDKDAIVSALDGLRANAKTDVAQNAISELKNGLITGKFSADSFRQSMNNLIDEGIINGTDGGVISSKLDSIQNKIESDSEISKHLINSDGTLNFGGSGLGEMTSIAKQKADTAKSSYDQLYKGSSESDKQEMDRYIAQSEKIVEKSVQQAQGATKVDNKNDSHYQMGYTSTNSTQSSSTSNNSSVSSDGLNIDLSTTAPEPLKPDDYNISSSGGLHLNQQQVEEQRLDSERAKLDDDLERMTNDINKMSSNDNNQKFKLKDE